MYSLSLRHKLYSWIFFGILILIGIFLYQDYGLSWDEPVQRGIGIQAYNYATTGDQTYLRMYDKIYGVGFELPLILIEKKLGLEDSRDIFLMRHLVQVLFFAFACFVFFRMNLRLFGSLKIAIVPALILVFTPRIFGHAFFNSKDIPFLCMYIISFSALHRYLLKPGYWRLILLGVCAGLLINFRIMGILFFGSALVCFFVYLLKQRKFKFLIHALLFTCIAGLVLYATWPYLWIKPVESFKNSFLLMSKFPWQGSMLFRGMVIGPGEKLTQYLFWWILISVPVVYLILSGVGGVIFLGKNIRKPKQILDDPIRIMGWIFIINIIAPIAAVLYLRSILYDDWRQLYFIYPAMIVFVGYLLHFIEKWKPKFATVGSLICLMYISFIGFQMIRLHPYENVYFNEMVSHKKDYIQEHYDQDYWGTSFYEGLKHIAETDHSDTIRIFLFQDALKRNALLLPEKDRDRFVFMQNAGTEEGVAEKASQYYLTNFRYDYIDIIGNSQFKNIDYTVARQNSTILRVWKH